MLQAYQVKGQDSHDGTSSGPVLWGVAWHPSATPEEVHFKVVQMGSWAALFFFKLYVWVCGLHICMCMCVPGVCSLQGQKLLCTSCCCVPLAGSLTYSTELLLHYSLPFLSAPQTCTPSHHYWFLVSCSLCAVRHTLPSYPSSILQSCRRKAKEQLWPGKQQDRKWLEWRKMLSAHL